MRPKRDWKQLYKSPLYMNVSSSQLKINIYCNVMFFMLWILRQCYLVILLRRKTTANDKKQEDPLQKNFDLLGVFYACQVSLTTKPDFGHASDEWAFVLSRVNAQGDVQLSD